MLEMLTKPHKMQEAIAQLTEFLFKMEHLLTSIDAHLEKIDDALTREKN